MIGLQCGRLNYSGGGSALGSVELVWGGNNRKYLLAAMASGTLPLIWPKDFL